ncbi:hypothetical protein KY290_001611 [Solanum tuberosum]|uniref:Uncharacterized protein n=1 Tax=Solanum tuberosum TaxID=4113 RepID=A0ABQ7WMS3_SOLTU|nr:hypothetical protein KY290_001611 [Solanum tuberosum]
MAESSCNGLVLVLNEEPYNSKLSSSSSQEWCLYCVCSWVQFGFWRRLESSISHQVARMVSLHTRVFNDVVLAAPGEGNFILYNKKQWGEMNIDGIIVQSLYGLELSWRVLCLLYMIGKGNEYHPEMMFVLRNDKEFYEW